MKKAPPRRRRAKLHAPPGDPQELIGTSVDFPRWLLEALEEEVELTGHSRGSIVSEIVEGWAHGRSREAKRKRFRVG